MKDSARDSDHVFNPTTGFIGTQLRRAKARPLIIFAVSALVALVVVGGLEYSAT